MIAAIILQFEGRAERGAVGKILWPDSDEMSMRASLRNLVRQIRRWEERSGIRLLLASKRFLERDNTCYATDLERMLSYSYASQPALLDGVLPLLGGKLLANTKLHEDRLEIWLDDQRAYVTRRIRHSLFAALAGERKAARKVAEVIERFSPHDEKLWRVKIQFAADEAGPRAAMEVFEAFRLLLRSELGVEPDEETLRLAQTFRDQVSLFSEIGWSEQQKSCASSSGQLLPRLMVCLPEYEKEAVQWRDRIVSFVDDITIALCDNKAFEVVAPHTARTQAKSNSGNPVLEFGLNFLVESHILSEPSDYQLVVSLIAARSRRIIWSDRLSLTTELAPNSRMRFLRSITTALTSQIEGAVLNDRVAAVAGDAYIDYLLGKQHLLNLNLAEIRRGRRYLRASSRKASDFGLNYSWLARSYLMEWILLARQDQELLVKACDLSTRAIEIDPLDGTAHREFGRALFFMGDCDRAIEELEVAVDRSPHNADLLADCADCLVHHSELDAAASHIEKALSLNPLAPDQYYWTAGAIEFFRENYSKALDTLMLMEDQAPSARLLAASSAMAGRFDIARKFRNQVLSTYPDFNVERWTSTIPQRKPEHRSLYAYALKLAGL